MSFLDPGVREGEKFPLLFLLFGKYVCVLTYNAVSYSTKHKICKYINKIYKLWAAGPSPLKLEGLDSECSAAFHLSHPGCFPCHFPR